MDFWPDCSYNKGIQYINSVGVIQTVSFVINFSTWLTLTRVFLAPIIMATIYGRLWLASCLLFILAGMTDFFDGYCARYYRQETEFGRLLDPVADKILLFSTLFALYQISGQSILPTWFMCVMLSKDALLMLGGLWLVIKKKSAVLAPSWLAKCTTALCMIFAVYVMLIHYGIMSTGYVSYFIQFFTISAVLIALDYSSKFFRYLL